MKISSPVFEDNGSIPEKYTCEGEDVNPPLEIFDIPEDTKSLVLIMDDPDAPIGTFIHWVVWNIEPQNEIKENTVPGEQGMNNFGKTDYGGPCPPSEEHRYYFKVYALDTKLDLPDSTTKQDLLDAMKPHILDKAKLMGRFSR